VVARAAATVPDRLSRPGHHGVCRSRPASGAAAPANVRYRGHERSGLCRAAGHDGRRRTGAHHVADPGPRRWDEREPVSREGRPRAAAPRAHGRADPYRHRRRAAACHGEVRSRGETAPGKGPRRPRRGDPDPQSAGAPEGRTGASVPGGFRCGTDRARTSSGSAQNDQPMQIDQRCPVTKHGRGDGQAPHVGRVPTHRGGSAPTTIPGRRRSCRT
jgi:hypothetical protein